MERTGWGEGGRSSHTQHQTRVNFCGQNPDQFNSLTQAIAMGTVPKDLLFPP